MRQAASVNPTRWEILTTLKKNGRMTVDGLSEHFGTSGVTVRYHLAALRAAGLVDARTERRGMGRPVDLYQITEAADEMFPRSYDALAVDILAQLEESEGDARIQAIFARGAEKLREVYAPRLAGKSFPEKVAEIARILDENGYLAAWKRDGDAFIITEYNCAVANVAKRYAHPCHYEMKLLQELTGAEVERVQHKVAGHHCCAYIIREHGEQA
ncbi:MAG: ArsR family transcriptional regulator [Armatimonadetes bacterium]|nr:ArsR family transcriptional regulator [Armatimonadota bacterium]